MPDRRRHRGPHPEDERLFAAGAQPALRAAVRDVSWLWSRGYPGPATLKLAGDRYRLTERQRTAVRRAACADAALADRLGRRVELEAVGGRPLLVDGYNVLTTVEAALGGGVLLLCRDGCLRDMASMHGSYRKVEETEPAVRQVGQTLRRLSAGPVRWLLDQPVSNSGRLKTLIERIAGKNGWDWTVELLANPDRELAGSEAVVATADGAVLDECGPWLNLARYAAEEAAPNHAWVDLRGEREVDARFGG